MQKFTSFDLRVMCRDSASVVTDSVQGKVKVMEEGVALQIAEETGSHPREVYTCAMREGVWPLRYLRNTESISLREQLRLSESGAAVVGAGGLGGFVISFLARLGIGYLLVIDKDVFDQSNLNRQAFAGVDSLNRSKAEVSEESVRNMNPGVEMDVIHGDVAIDVENWSGMQVIVDALDNIRDRFFLEKLAGKLGIPFCHAAVSGFEGRLMTVFPEDRGLSLLYGEEETGEDGEELQDRLGVPVVSPALIASLQATEVIKILLGKGSDLRERMLYVDLENVYTEIFSL